MPSALGRALVLAALLAAAALPAVASGATTQADKPDLVPALPGVPYTNQVAPVYVDSFEQPGHVLYRFDTEIVNSGGVLDLFRAGNGDAMQAIWPGGVPGQLTSGGYADPNHAPTDPSATYEDLSALHGASFVYSAATGHNHWHFQAAARYVLNLPGGGVRNSAKVGFCMADANPRYFPYGQTGGGAQTFCAPGNPAASFVRMGISPGTYDLYNSQVADQWIDVTGLAPGSYTLTATVNPSGYIDESNTANNTLTVSRTIPGTTAAAASATTTSGHQVAVALSGTVVGASVPARQSGSCAPKSGTYSCYVTASANGPLDFAAATAPAHGTVSYSSGGNLTGTATYTPQAGYVGTDSFSYTTTDARGLTSLPATVTITVTSQAGAPVNTALPVVSGTAQQGSQLTTSNGSWTASPAPTYSYQWQRCDTSGNNCIAMSGATSQTYTSQAADVGTTLRATVTASNSGGSTTATSSQTPTIVAASGGNSGGGGGGGTPPAPTPPTTTTTPVETTQTTTTPAAPKPEVLVIRVHGAPARMRRSSVFRVRVSASTRSVATLFLTTLSGRRLGRVGATLSPTVKTIAVPSPRTLSKARYVIVIFARAGKTSASSRVTVSLR